MWVQACEMLERAERLHRQFFRLTMSEHARAVWGPPIDMFEDEREIVVVVALPGVIVERIEVAINPGALVVRAESEIPIKGRECAIHRMEIPYGYFERRIALPEVPLKLGAQEFVNGCLILTLQKVG